jgi:hypothetical protein
MSHAPDSNLTAKEWSVRIFISEHDGSTHAEARLDTGAGTGLTGTGSARLSPKDNDVPEIGDELAAARALAELAGRLLRTADEDVEEATGLRRDSARDTAWSS